MDLIDSDVLVDAHDPSVDARYTVARGLMDRPFGQRQGVLSEQVLQKLFVTVTKKVRVPVNADLATPAAAQPQPLACARAAG